MDNDFTPNRSDPISLSTVLGRGGVILAAAVLLSALAGAVGDRHAVPVTPTPAQATASPAEVEAIRVELEAARGALAVEQLKNRRAEAVQGYSAQYKIPADLASAIYDHAVTEGIDPALAFRLVQVESNFRPNARSRAKAFGYTQLKLGTARHYEPWVTEKDLSTRDVNLRIGFRFLRDLQRQYGGDANLALLAFNRGPARVNEYLDSHSDPDNGYGATVMGAGHSSKP